MADVKNATTTSSARNRNFACVVYPESAPEGWKDTLSRFCVSGFISPLHDKDVNPTGEPKKPHYHVMLMFPGKKSKPQVEEIFSKIGGVGCEVVGSARGYGRYLCHLDNPEKVQYAPTDVTNIAGADYLGLIGTSSDKHVAISEMQQFCDRYDVNSFYLLCNYADAHRSDWARVLHDTSAIFMREWLKSRQWSREMGYTCIKDTETGEIIFRSARDEPQGTP